MKTTTMSRNLVFKDIAHDLDKSLKQLFDKLIESEYVDLSKIPNVNGIYVFYENDKPIYVGRSNRKRLRKRLQEHARKSSNRNSATFAVLLAKEQKELNPEKD